MRTAEPLLAEVDLERRCEFMAIPMKCAQELLVVLALFVPLRQQARSDVDAAAIPTLRHHVHLAAGVFAVGLARMRRVRQIKVVRRAVHEGIYPQTPCICSD